MSSEEWNKWWNKRKGFSIIGNFLFYFREKFLVKSFVDVACERINDGFLLEAGCGSALSSILVKKMKKNVKVIALDFSSVALELAKKLSNKKSEDIFLIKADIHNLPFKDNSVNIAWNIGTLEHFRNVESVIKEMKRASKTVIGLVPKKSFFWTVFPWLLKHLKFEEDYCKLYTEDEYGTVFKKLFRNPEIKTIRCVKFIPYLVGIGE